MKRPPSPRAQQAAVDEWNAKWQVGQRVCVTLDDGSVFATETCGEAELLGGHTAVIWLKRMTSCFLLSRCQPVVVMIEGCLHRPDKRECDICRPLNTGVVGEAA